MFYTDAPFNRILPAGIVLICRPWPRTRFILTNVRTFTWNSFVRRFLWGMLATGEREVLSFASRVKCKQSRERLNSNVKYIFDFNPGVCTRPMENSYKILEPYLVTSLMFHMRTILIEDARSMNIYLRRIIRFCSAQCGFRLHRNRNLNCVALLATLLIAIRWIRANSICILL